MKQNFVNGTVTKPKEGDTNYDQWLRVDRMVRLWMLKAISKEIIAGFWYSMIDLELWMDLKEQFENRMSQCYTKSKDKYA